MSFAFLPFYTGDYRRDTQHLSMLEHGAYCLMLMHCWDQKGPLPLDERRIFGICNARSNEEMGAVRHVLGEFFTRMDDGWYNRRMQLEIERAEAVSSKRSDAGKRGYEAKAKSLVKKAIQANARQVLSKSLASASTPTPTLTPTPTPTELPLSHSVDTDPPLRGLPACPVEKIIEIWNATVGNAGGQRAINLSAKRRAMIASRWREVAPATVEEGIKWFEDLFRVHVAPSKFATGRKPGKDGNAWRIGINNVMRSELQLDEIAEGKYA